MAVEGYIWVSANLSIPPQSRESPRQPNGWPSVSAAASVGAIGLCPMVATGNPHPLGKGRIAATAPVRLAGTKNAPTFTKEPNKNQIGGKKNA